MVFQISSNFLCGFTYTSQYWSPPGYYSYAAFSYDRGLASLTVDGVGVGPTRRSHQQPPKDGVQPFRKIINISHSLVSAMLNFNAIIEGAASPLDGLILTTSLASEPETFPPLSILVSAADDTPLCWDTLYPKYLPHDRI
ncbi:hypothetical protein K438DRAFT_1952876 [Mycena galopus ATCC 62051]|nr:hypothetical protein K438DRAFT_1952876 [Mycena galopus ATCC 62051]